MTVNIRPAVARSAFIQRVIVLLCFMALLSACQVAPPPGVTPVSPFDATRYLGTWHEVARLDHRFERGLSSVTAEYRDRGETIEVINRGVEVSTGQWREAVGKARFLGPRDVASLKVSFFGPFYGGYHVVALDPQYQWALVMGPTRNYFWVLARQPDMDETLYQSLLVRAKSLGVDTRRLIRLRPAQPGHVLDFN